ncbi:MAG: nucleoid-associated protein [Halomonadaceae bacterium]|nr:MAG: nucleoid-associated protein [Halomonadaceae bacterium]
MAIQQLRLLFASQEDPSKPVRVQAGAPLQEPGGDYEALHRQFKRLFNAKPGKGYGSFSEDIGNHPLAAWLKDYLEGRQSFTSFSDQVLSRWQDLIAQSEAEVDGPLMLVHEALADGEVIYLFALETDSTLRLDSDLALETSDSISQSRLSLAVRIEKDDWLGEHPGNNYLTLIQARGTGERGKQFADLVGFHSHVDVAQETQTFMDAVESFAREAEPEQAQAVRAKAYAFCQEQEALGEPVPLSELSGYLDDSAPERFSQHAAQSQSLAPDTVLHPDRRKVRKLVRLSGSGNGLSLSFSSDLVNQAIHYDVSKDALIITKLPKGLKEQLQSYLERD